MLWGRNLYNPEDLRRSLLGGGHENEGDHLLPELNSDLHGAALALEEGQLVFGECFENGRKAISPDHGRRGHRGCVLRQPHRTRAHDRQQRHSRAIHQPIVRQATLQELTAPEHQVNLLLG